MLHRNTPVGLPKKNCCRIFSIKVFQYILIGFYEFPPSALFEEIENKFRKNIYYNVIIPPKGLQFSAN